MIFETRSNLPAIAITAVSGIVMPRSKRMRLRNWSAFELLNFKYKAEADNRAMKTPAQSCTLL